MGKLTNIVKGAVLGLSAGYAFVLGCNYAMNHGRIFHGKAMQTVTLIDGAYSKTKFSQTRLENYQKDEVAQHGFSRSTFITDGGIDGKFDGTVDRISVFEHFGEEGYVLVREKNYESNKEEFDRADKTLVEQKKRFEEYF